MIFFIAILIFVICKAVIKYSGEAAPGARSGANEANAVVCAKRMDISGGERTSVHYYVTFEMEDASRLELPVKGFEYGRLAEGDRGVLRVAGGRFAGFVRNESRFSAADPEKAAHRCPACGAAYTGRVCEYCDTPWVEPAAK